MAGFILRPILVFFIHVVVFVFAYILAFFLRCDFVFHDKYYVMLWQTIFYVILIKSIVFFYFRHFHSQWFYASVSDLRMIITTSFVALCVLSLFIILFEHFSLLRMPRSIPLLDFFLTICLLGGFRLTFRYIQEDIVPAMRHEKRKTALLVGANYEGGRLASFMNSQRDIEYKIIGFVTTHPYKIRKQIGRIPVLGQIDDIVAVTHKTHASVVFVAAGVLAGPVFRVLMDRCNKNGIRVLVLPKTNIQASQRIPIRDIHIDDLLKRDVIRLDNSRIDEMLKGKRILVTGAGGSIGSEICRQLMSFHPSSLFLMGRGENRIFYIDRELRAMNSSTELIPVIGDVANPKRVEEIFEYCRADVVFHAAAHKHVPLMEANISEAIHNNIYGTKVVADASEKFGVNKFVMVSTDKAVNPSSVMGLSKQMAERYVHALSASSQTKFVVTRFGNVLGSAGSVVPIFTQQIQHGGPVTITDERMTRFFMTIPEAAQLVLEAAAMGKGGEIFVLDMGNPVKILDLAKDMIHLAGLPEESIEIQVTGMRPGEKLYEELYFEAEKNIQTDNPKLTAAVHRPLDLEVVRAQIDELIALEYAPEDQIRRKFKEVVPEYLWEPPQDNV